MASIRRTLDHSEGVGLEEISLEHVGEVVDQAYLVRTLRSPEACGDEAIEPGIFLTFEEDVFELLRYQTLSEAAIRSALAKQHERDGLPNPVAKRTDVRA